MRRRNPHLDAVDRAAAGVDDDDVGDVVVAVSWMPPSAR